MKYICKYCGKEFESTIGKTVHENSCKLNPNRVQKVYPKKECRYCHNLYTVQCINHHEETCKLNPHKDEKYYCGLCHKSFNTTKELHLQEFHHFNIEKNKYICPYCGKEFDHQFSLKRHMNGCEYNPSRKDYNNSLIESINKNHPDLLNHIEIIGDYYRVRQSHIKVKCKHCGEIYDEDLNNIIRIGSWRCQKHCSNLIRKQKILDDRKNKLYEDIEKNNSEFLTKFEIIGDWDGNLRSKIKVKCKKCGNEKSISVGWILSNHQLICKGCTILNKLEFNKLILSKKEVIDWCIQYKPKLLERLKIVNETINLLEDTKIQCKCLKCNNTIEISRDTFFRKDTKNILCPNCQKRHYETEKYLISLINSHKISNEKYICKYCGKEYKSKNALAQHECRCKSNPNKLKYDKKWICPYCEKEFNNPQSYAGHKTMCIKNPNWETLKNKRYYGK